MTWKLGRLGLAVAGAAIAGSQRVGGLWLLVISAKLTVAIAFYGYTRQAVAILPAMFLFVAIFVDFLLRRVSTRPLGPALSAAIVMAAIAIDARAAWTRQHLDVIPERPVAVRSAPHWGRGAFGSAGRLTIRARP